MEDIEQIRQSAEKEKKIKLFLRLNFLLCVVLIGTIAFNILKIPLFRDNALLIFVAIFSTATVFLSAARILKERKVSIELLASIALAVSLIEGEWVSAIFINLMIAFARTFIGYVKVRSHSAINGLLKLKPEKIRIEQDGKIVEIQAKGVRKNDLVVVGLGERVPVDGIVEEGEAEVEQSSITGESLPVAKKVGDKILSFTTIVSGNLKIRAEKVGKDTTFEKIVSLVEKSQENKAPIYTIINIFSKWYVILTLIGSLVVYLISRDVSLVLALLLVSCADDIAIATPVALMSAITHSAKHGAIVKGGDFLEGLSNVKTIIFDKTGTLTRGKLKIQNIFSFNNHDRKDVLRLATAVSSRSSHPIAKTIIDQAKKEMIEYPEPEKFEEYSGKGMTAVYRNELIVTGKSDFLQKMGIKMTQQEIDQVNTEVSKGFNVTLVGYNNNLVGFLVLADELRPKLKETIKELKELGVEKIVMLTGDNEEIAKKTAEALGVDEFYANLLPEDKIKYLKRYLNKKSKVIMVGDGVNDAPTLAMSDIGIAMGAIGSDVAIEAADIAMMKDDLSQLPGLIKIGRTTISVIKQNIVMWGILNVLGFSLVFLHVLNPAGAALWNFATDFIPIINSLRLFR